MSGGFFRVDMTKVKMDVMRPWIAKRVTELIGFEDEVLINFIYSLLEGKAETDRIANEIHRKKEKEKQEIEQEKIKMDGDGAMPRDKHDELDLHVKNDAGGSGINPADDKERYKRNGRRRPSRKKRSISPSKSNSGSYSERHEKYSTARRASPSKESESPSENRKETRLVEGRPMVSLRSTSPRGSSYQKRERMVPGSPNPLQKAAGQKPHHDSSGTCADDENKFSSRETGDHKYRSSRKISPVPVRHRTQLSLLESMVLLMVQSQGRPNFRTVTGFLTGWITKNVMNDNTCQQLLEPLV
ncbi:UNVERIFIED_CONTAM: PWI domain-containing protein [Sesamum angustifolium]|uniref:PWI domain-containing protein n=1 Tax=Sesamum angustifolium TaxID=2727405 RepID=A0AAW2QTB0_9LAMI